MIAVIKSGPGIFVVAGVAGALLLLACTLVGCTTAAERRATENARVEKQAAAEINRICALPEAEREAELKKIKDQSGMVLYCGSK